MGRCCEATVTHSCCEAESAPEQGGCPKSGGLCVVWGKLRVKKKKKRQDEAGKTSHRLISVPVGASGRDAHDPCWR